MSGIDKTLKFFLISASTILLVLILLDVIFIKDYKDVLIEAHGLLLDVLLFGIILTIYDLKRNRREKIVKLFEELDDYRNWNDEIAKRRVLGIIKRLQKLGISKIRMDNLYLEGVDLNGIDLSGSSFYNTNLSSAHLLNSKLNDCDFSFSFLNDTNFARSDLRRSNFSGAELENACLGLCNLTFCDFSYANLKNTDFKSSILYYAIFFETKNSETYFRNCKLKYSSLNEAFKGLENYDEVKDMFYLDQKKFFDENKEPYYLVKLLSEKEN